MDFEEAEASNPVTIKERIDNALSSLSDLSTASLSRSEILSGLSGDLAEYYGYIQELSEFLLDLFPPAECVQYMEASDRPRPLVIRTNTLKTNRKDLMETLRKRGVTVEDIDWSKVAIKVTESSVPIGATPEYLAGHYMLQSAASLNPVMALAPLPGEKVLDMSAAPGGKTSYIAQLMKNSGTLIANDLKMERQKATVANLHRLGVKNAVVCCYDGRKIGSNMKGFDRVLLDAPCSGLGVISRDQSVKIQRTVRDIQRISHLQKELLRAAVDAVDPHSPTGGIVVYSTCSVSTEENEQVVDFILRRRFVRLVETGLEVGKPGFTRHKERRFHPSLVLTRRFYPHVHNMDGFYVAKLKKYKNGIRGEEEEEGATEDEDLDNYIDKDTDDCELDNSYATETQPAEGDTGVLDKKNMRASYKEEYVSLTTQERKKTFVLEEKETKTVEQEKKLSSKETGKSLQSSVQEEKDAKTSTKENKKTLSSASEIKKTSVQGEIKLSAQEEKTTLVQEEKKTSSLEIKKTSTQEEKKSSEEKKSVQEEKKSSSEIAKGEKKLSVQEEKKISVQGEKKLSVQEEKKTSFKELKKQSTPVDSLTIRTGELTAADQRGPMTGAPAGLQIRGEPRKRKRSIQDLRVQMRRTAQTSRQED